MATPPSIMTALEELDVAKSISLLPKWKDRSSIHYTVEQHVSGEETSDKFTISVDIYREEARVYNVFNQLIFTGYGGIRNFDDNMLVVSALNFFRREVMVLEKEKLILTSENNSYRKITLKRNKEHNSFFVFQEKNAPNINFEICSNIRTKFESGLVSVDYRPDKLLAMERGLLLMAAVKLMHCHYLVHLQPIPTSLPYLSLPGIPKEPLSMLQTISDIETVARCTVTPKNQMIFEWIDCRTDSIVLISETSEKLHQKTMTKSICFKDEFGLLQFQIDYKGSTHDFELRDSKLRVIGERRDKRKFLVYGLETLTSQYGLASESKIKAGTNIYRICKGRENKAEFYLKSQWPVVHISMNPTLDVKFKAIVLCYAIDIALFNFRMLSLIHKTTIEAYPFRPIVK